VSEVLYHAYYITRNVLSVNPRLSDLGFSAYNGIIKGCFAWGCCALVAAKFSSYSRPLCLMMRRFLLLTLNIAHSIVAIAPACPPFSAALLPVDASVLKGLRWSDFPSLSVALVVPDLVLSSGNSAKLYCSPESIKRGSLPFKVIQIDLAQCQQTRGIQAY